MGHLRTPRRGAALALCAAAAAVLAASAAGAGQVYREAFHAQGSNIDANFCDAGLRVRIDYTIDGRFQIVPHGRDRVEYFLQHGNRIEVITNLANGRVVTTSSTVTEKDKVVTDNGDGTLTILVLATGNDVAYGANGKAIARNPGQVWFEILVDAASGDVIDFLGVVKGSTGRSDDFCSAFVPALSS